MNKILDKLNRTYTLAAFGICMALNHPGISATDMTNADELKTIGNDMQQLSVHEKRDVEHKNAGENNVSQKSEGVDLPLSHSQPTVQYKPRKRPQYSKDDLLKRIGSETEEAFSLMTDAEFKSKLGELKYGYSLNNALIDFYADLAEPRWQKEREAKEEEEMRKAAQAMKQYTTAVQNLKVKSIQPMDSQIFLVKDPETGIEDCITCSPDTQKISFEYSQELDDALALLPPVRYHEFFTLHEGDRGYDK